MSFHVVRRDGAVLRCSRTLATAKPWSDTIRLPSRTWRATAVSSAAPMRRPEDGEMSYQASNYVQLSWKNPPRCLQGCVIHPVANADALSNDFAHFRLTCSCGSDNWNVLGHSADNLLLCPLTLRCTGCGKEEMVFDIEKHGYDAELGHGCSSIRAEGPQVTLSCENCGRQSFATTAVVSYQCEEGDLDRDGMPPAQDLFDVFGLDVRCVGCGHENTVCDYECA